jgi:hypothetical protein
MQRGKCRSWRSWKFGLPLNYKDDAHSGSGKFTLGTVRHQGQCRCAPPGRPFGKMLPFCQKILNLTRPMKGVVPFVFFNLASLAEIISMVRNPRLENHQL